MRCDLSVALCALLMIACMAVQAAFTTVPLNWQDAAAYTVQVQVDGDTYTMQLGTYSSNVWVACARFKDKTCSYKCDNVLSVEMRNLCVSESTANVSIKGTNISFSQFPIAVQQDQEPVPTNRTLVPPYSEPIYPEQDHPLTNSSQGVLGLGLLSMLNGKQVPAADQSMVLKAMKSFGLYLSRDKSANSSFLWINGVDSDLLTTKKLSTILRTDHVPINVSSWTTGTWATTIDGIRFDDDSPVFAAVPQAGADKSVAAIISINTAVLSLSVHAFTAFQAAYLPQALCRPSSNLQIARFYVCKRAVMDSLPQLTIRLGSNFFYLDPEDYTHTSSGNASNVVVEIAPWSNDDQNWVLGQPFLRKFPSHFVVQDASVDFYCQQNVTCQHVDEFYPDWIDPPSRRPNDTPATRSPNDGESAYSTKAAQKAVGMIFGLAAGFILLVIVAVVLIRKHRPKKVAKEVPVAMPVEGEAEEHTIYVVVQTPNN